MKRPRERYEVKVGDCEWIGIMARSPGHAARQVFRLLIAGGVIKRQPRSVDGGWEGVLIR